jgi:hypothetical protein
LAEIAFEEYCFGRLTYKQISDKYGKHSITVQRNFDSLRINYFLNIPTDRNIDISFDGVYFGWSLCYVVFRADGKTIYFKRCSERIDNIAQCLKDIEGLGYIFKSFTIDGKKGMVEYLRTTYPLVPIQYCQFHQKKTIRHYLTKEPKTECGQELKRFLRSITSMSKEEFIRGLTYLTEEYKGFLSERNENRQYMHRRLRSAFRSLIKHTD